MKGITNTFIKERGDRVLILSGVGARAGFSCQMTDLIPNLDLVEKGQCFPLRIYEERGETLDIFSASKVGQGQVASDGISDDGFLHFQNSYKGERFTKEDLFYYTYGLLHSPDFRGRFKDNLSKELPRIPAVKSFQDFLSLSDAGRKLGELHVNFESVEPYPVGFKQGDLRLSVIDDPKSFYRVEKMKFPNKKDKSVVFYNSNITMQGIPLEAFDYIVNGKPALVWVMERQCVKTDKASGIQNDANDYANETMGNPAYPLELFQRVITVSLETMKLVRSLPKLVVE